MGIGHPARRLKRQHVPVTVKNGAQRHVRGRRRGHERDAVLRLRSLRLAVRALLRHLQAHDGLRKNFARTLDFSGIRKTCRSRGTCRGVEIQRGWESAWG